MITTIQLPVGLEKEVMPEVVAILESRLGHPNRPEATSLYVLSDRLGQTSALAFWGDAVEKGPALANPELFPWTLANGPCGFIARHFGIKGPNYTFVVDPEDAASIEWIAQSAHSEKIELALHDAWVIVLK
jgi:3-oxoacyl-(acyl-carrier-protein) synthase